MAGAQRAVVVGGCLAMAYTQITTSPALIQFARGLGADGFHIGILGAVPTGLFFVQFAAAVLATRLHYRRWWWFTATMLHRLSYIPVALGPWLAPDLPASTWIWILIGVTILNHALLHFGAPLWLSWMGDYLPHRGLSQFWGIRHLWQQWTAAATLLLCAVVTRHSGLGGWNAFGLLIGIATVLGVVDILLFLKVEEPPVTQSATSDWRGVLSAPFRDQQYRSFISYSCFWNFAAMVGSPFISMYLLEHVGMTIDRVLLLWALSWVGGAMLSRRFGHIAENYGHRPLLILCTMLKALNMGAMLVTPRDPDLAFWLLVPILAMDAQLNAGINIANQGYMLKYSPRENRTTFLAAGTALAGMIGGLTAVAAGWWLTRLSSWTLDFAGAHFVGFHVLFFSSMLLRISAIALACRVREPSAQGTATVVRELVGAWPARILRFPRAEIVPVADAESGWSDGAAVTEEDLLLNRRSAVAAQNSTAAAVLAIPGADFDERFNATAARGAASSSEFKSVERSERKAA